MPHACGARPIGRIRIGLILVCALVAVGIYGGIQLSYHYWAYWNLREEAERVAIDVAANERALVNARPMIIARAREYDITLTENDIGITREPASVTISFAWERSIEFPYYTFPVNFQVNATIRPSR